MMKYLGASLGNCVHVAGIANFFSIAEQEGHNTSFLGAAVPPEEIIRAAAEWKPDVVCISYRLTPENLPALLDVIQEGIHTHHLEGIRWSFGGTPPTVAVARTYDFIEAYFDGSERRDASIAFIRGQFDRDVRQKPAQNLVDRIAEKKPYPIIRHHFGLPSLEDTIKGVHTIAESEILDIISIGPDQNTQEYFFRLDKRRKEYDGAGGVPIRSKQDFENLYKASRTGNYPLLRCYSGTADVIRMGEVLNQTIHNAWAAIPLCWYNTLDGRSKRPPEQSIAENQQAVAWHAQQGIPVELNESHHWSLRDAHDTIAVVMAYVAAYNAKQLGVQNYVAQYMFNTPSATHPRMDIAKMLAKRDLIEGLHEDSFTSYRQVRTGLTSLSSNLNMAKGQLASSIYTAMALEPDIVHVVSFSEADHAANAADVIESCDIIHGVVDSTMGMTDFEADPAVQTRRQQLLDEANILINYITENYSTYEDPLTSPVVLANCIKRGVLDAPHLRNNPWSAGKLTTRMIDGKCVAYSGELKREMGEKERLESIDEHTIESVV